MPLDQVRLIYILAASHSGSTLLAFLLASHLDVCTVGELKAGNLGDVARYRCSCGQLIRECSFWSAIRADLASQGLPFDLARPPTDFASVESRYARRLLRPLHRGGLVESIRDVALALSPRWRHHMDRAQAANAALAARVCARLCAQVIVDSSKTAIRLKYLLRNPRLDVRVVRLVRDGRAVANTYMNPAVYADASNPALRGGGSGDSRDAERQPMALAAREWRRSNEEADAVLRHVSRERCLQVRYEDLCTSPSEVQAQVWRFASLDDRGPVAPFRSREHHVIGNGMRLDDTRQVQADQRWVSALQPADLEVFDRIAGSLNRRFGYAAGSS
jgi:hypothetical protein